MLRDEILEYPYQGTIKRIVEGDSVDVEEIVYEGVMDEHMVTQVEGRTLQTSTYIISIPLVKDENDVYAIPRKGDEIELLRYGETIKFTVENAEPSQIGGVSIYAARNSW